eukprot:9467047-Pyramimonas_sp.AAC.1
MMFQPTLASITSKNFEHQESAETGGLSRGGPWEAALVRHCFDTFLRARNYFWGAKKRRHKHKLFALRAEFLDPRLAPPRGASGAAPGALGLQRRSKTSTRSAKS